MGFLGEASWRRIQFVAWLALFVLLLAEASVGVPALWNDRLPSWGFDATHSLGVARLDGRHTGATVHAVEPRLAAELRHGDRVVFPSVAQRWRVPAEGATVQVRHEQPGAPARLLTLRAEVRPFTPNERFDYLCRLLQAVPAMALALLLARQRPLQAGSRHLALAFLCFGTVPFLNFSFGQALAPQWVKTLAFVATPCAVYQLMRFAQVGAQHCSHPLQALLQQALWPVRALVLLAVGLLLLYFSGRAVPLLQPVLGATLALCQLLTLLALWVTLTRSSGQSRARARIMLAAFLTGVAPISLLLAAGDTLPGFEPGPLGWPLFLLFFGYLLSYLGLGYGVLRHRVFDLVLARDRALVYGVAVLLVTGTVLLLKTVLQPPLHALLALLGDGMERKLLEAALAVGVYLSGHYTFHWLDHGVQHLVFQRRRRQAEQLQQFLREAQHIAGQETLLRRLHEELERFTEQAGNVIYLRLAGGDFAQVFNSVPRAPHLLDGDDALLVTLRQSARPRWLESGQRAQGDSEAVGSLALPMLRRGQLAGLVVLGPRPDHEPYRPEDVKLMAEVVEHVALDLQAIAAARWEQAATEGPAHHAQGH